jgi:glycosyltransferase involved in cell wall biosynthesis
MCGRRVTILGAPLRIALMSTAPPRACGIASYSASLARALTHHRHPAVSVDWVPLTFPGDVPRVGSELARLPVGLGDARAVESAAQRVNQSRPDAISIQHEFGLYGDWRGRYRDGLVPFLQRLRVPAITTLHTVLPNPSDSVRSVVQSVCAKSAAVVVPCRAAITILTQEYGVPASKLTLIRHAAEPPSRHNGSYASCRVSGSGPRILTFGLLGPGKGVEQMIRAMRQLVMTWPAATYTIAGRMHPCLPQSSAVAYRHELHHLVSELGLASNVRMIPRYIDDSELDGLLTQADIVVTPNPDLRQASSGTLARALAASRPVVTGHHAHARDVVDAGAALAVSEVTAETLVDAVGQLLADEKQRRAVAGAAGRYASKMTWAETAELMERVLRDVRAEIAGNVQ